MSTIILLAQAFFERQALLQTQNLREAGLRAAETGRRMAIAGIFFGLAGIFFFSALLVAVIDLGLQIDRSGTFQFSGLMISSTILTLFGLFSAFAGWLANRESRAVPPPTPAPPTSELRTLLEAVAVGFLKEYLENQKRPESEPAETSEQAT